MATTTTFESARTSRGYKLTLIITENSTSIPDNTSSCSYELRISSNSYTYGDYGTGFDAYVNGQRIAYQDRNSGVKSSCLSREPSYTTLSTGSFTIAHNSDGKLENVAVTASLDIGGSPAPGAMSLSGTMSFTDIPRTSSLTIPSLTCGSSATITINKEDNSLTNTVAYSVNNSSFTTIGTAKTTAASVTWNPVPLSLQNNFTTSPTGTIYIRCITYDSTGNTEVGRKTYTVTVAASSVPTIGTPAFNPVNTNTFLSTTNYYVSGFSRVKITCSASGLYGATIVSWQITGLDSTYSVSGTALDYTTAVQSITGSKNITIKVTDSRGLQNSVTVSDALTYLVYYNPSISSLDCTRGTYSGGTWTSNENGNHIRVIVSATFTIDGNTYTGSGVSVAVTGQTTQYVTGTPSSGVLSGTKYFTGTSIDNEYTVTASVTDKLGGSGSKNATVTSGSVLMNWNPTLNSVGLGKIATAANRVQSAWDMSVEKSSATAAYFRAENTLGSVDLQISAAGNSGVYSTTNGHWIVYDDTNGHTHLPAYQGDSAFVLNSSSFSSLDDFVQKLYDNRLRAGAVLFNNANQYITPLAIEWYHCYFVFQSAPAASGDVRLHLHCWGQSSLVVTHILITGNNTSGYSINSYERNAYTAGDILTEQDMPFASGWVTSSQTELALFFPLAKPLLGVSGATLNSATFTIRTAAGGYLQYYNGSTYTQMFNVPMQYDSVSFRYRTGGILIYFTCSNKWGLNSSAVTNNSLVSLAAGSLSITLS